MEERKRDALEEKWKVDEKEKQGAVGKEIINFWTVNFNNEDIM